MSRPALLLVSGWLILVDAHSCSIQSIPEYEIVGWQSDGCYRGTWSIISTCLTTILACTWGIQHLNVPARSDGTWKKFKRKAKWMMITVLFPELVLIHAVLEFHMAWDALTLMANRNKPVHWPWWFRARPVAWLPYCRRYLDKSDEEKQHNPVSDSSVSEEWTLAHCYFANMGGFIYDKDGDLLLLTAQHLADSPSRCPPIKEDDIKDRSKQDWLAKTFASFQILQLILTLITRAIQDLRFSQLETVTLSFAICGVLIYYVNIYKPQNIDRPVEINPAGSILNGTPIEKPTLSVLGLPIEPHETRVSKDVIVVSSNRTYDSFWAIMLNQQSRAAMSTDPDKAPRIPNDNIPLYKGNNGAHPAVYLLALTSGLFGAVHAVAWNFQFPSQAEKLLWHIATAVSAVSPIVGLLTIPLTQITTSAGDPEAFIQNCLRLLKEFLWNNKTEYPVQEAIIALEHALENTILQRDSHSKSYSEIFEADKRGRCQFIIEVSNFLCLKGRFKDPNPEAFDLYENQEFTQNFRRLATVVNGSAGKKISDTARTDQWPRRPFLHPIVNLFILYTTGILYCASRLIILGIALSSIREMPGSVYFETGWIAYLPKFSAN